MRLRSVIQGCVISIRVTRFLVVLAVAGVACSSSRAQAPQAGANDPQAIWNALSRPAFDPARIATVNDLVIERDRIRITLHSGTLHFTQPVNGVVTGAVFSGEGRFQMKPPNPQEEQQLQLFIKKNEINFTFSDAVFNFTDKTFDEVSAKVQWGGAAPTTDGLYASRIQQYEDLGATLLPRLFKSMMAQDRSRSAIFHIDMKTAEEGWVEAIYNASEPEDINVGRWGDFPGGVKIFDVWMSFPANGQTASEAFNIPFAKADYVIKSYDMDVKATNSAELSGSPTMKMEVRWPGERVFLFGLDSNLRVEKVSVTKDTSLTFFQAKERKDRNGSYGDYVVVVLPTPTQANQELVLSMKYSGRRAIQSAGPGNFFPESYGWYPARLTSSTSGDDFAGRFDWDIRFHSPKKYVPVFTGTKVSEDTEGDMIVTEWKSEIPMAVAGFAYGDFRVYTEKVGDIEVQVYANKEPDDTMAAIEKMGLNTGSMSPALLAPTIGNEMGNALRTFVNYYGPYPYKKLAITSIPAGYGQGWPGLIYLSALTFLDPAQLNSLRIPPNPRLTQFFRAHEASHQWWGHRVGWKSYHDQWMSEGFAQFSGNLYTQLRDNQKEYLDRLRADKQDLLAKDDHSHVVDSVGSIWMGYRTTSSIGWRRNAPDTATIIYNKGGYVLTMLRMMLSDSNPKSTDPDLRFKLMMQDFCKAFDNKPASTEDFKAIAEKHMTLGMDLENNHKLDWFFRQYVYGTGIARYEFHYDVKDAGNGQWAVTGTLKRTGVPDNWMDMVPMFMERDGKPLRFAFINATKPETQIDFKLPVNPGKLQINVNEELLAEIKQ